MSRIYHGNRTNYGEPVGILMLKTSFPRIPGDIGNASSFDYPVKYRVIKEANFSSVVEKPELSLCKPFIESAKELIGEGCKIIATSCGFLAIFQKEIEKELDVPFVSSSLLQVKYIYDTLPKNKKIGIITACAGKLGEKHFRGVDILDIPKAVIGLEGTYLYDVLVNQKHELDFERARTDMLGIAEELLTEHPDIGAFVLECTNMPPYAAAIQRAFDIPVYDITTLLNYMKAGFVRNDFVGYM